MITGQNSFKIDWRDWLRGMTTSDEVEDGGFSQQTTAVNLIAEPGVINAPGEILDKSTNLTDEIMSGAEKTGFLGDDQMFVDESGAFYTWSGSLLTKKVTVSSTSFTPGVSQLIPFNGKYYISSGISGADIVEWNGVTALDETWWSVTVTGGTGLQTATAWRPMVVWENQLWIGDGRFLRAVNSSNVTTNPLTLTNGDLIVALGFEKGTGKLLISTTNKADFSGTRSGNTRVMLYDGSSNKVDRVIFTDGLITTFKNLSSSTIVFYNRKMGKWTGRGIEFLRETGESQMYSQKITIRQDTLYYLVGNQVIAYGSVIGGQSPIFYPALKNNVGSFNSYKTILFLGEGVLGVGFATSKFYTFDTTAIVEVINGGMNFYTRRYDFNRKVNFKGIRLQFKTLPTSGTDNIITIQYLGDEGTSFKTLKTISTADLEPGQLEIDIPIVDGFTETSSLQFKLVLAPGTSTNVSSLRKMIIYHDPAEE